jgi:hypothetical protein
MVIFFSFILKGIVFTDKFYRYHGIISNILLVTSCVHLKKKTNTTRKKNLSKDIFIIFYDS